MSIIKMSPQYLAAESTLQNEVDAVENLVANMTNEYAVRMKDITQYSTFYKVALKRAEYFLKIKTDKTFENGKLLFSK